MTHRFDSFVIFGAMRTGSNFLETNLNEFPDIFCMGEAFNPEFVGTPKTDQILGFDVAGRDRDPHALLQAFRDQRDGLYGFRYFDVHDPRILETVLDDPRCAKVILYRNPVESYVSLQIAQQTGQWKLTNLKRRETRPIHFDADAFDVFLGKFNSYYQILQNELQTRGQTAFHLHYADLHDLDVINGLGQFLGARAPLEQLCKTLKPQNPEPLPNKVANFDDMALHLANWDYFGLAQVPMYEPARPATIGNFHACEGLPVLFMPIQGRLNRSVIDWMQQLDPNNGMLGNFTDKTLCEWFAQNRGHQKFTVLHHPVERVYDIFMHRILVFSPVSMNRFRNLLRRAYGLDLPETWEQAAALPLADIQHMFCTFVTMIGHNLRGQTPLPENAQWASYERVLQGLSQVAVPDRLIRSRDLASALPDIAQAVGLADPLPYHAGDIGWPILLEHIITDDIQRACEKTFARDYDLYGFSNWVSAHRP